MNNLRKLTLTILLFCSTSLFSAGFNTPMEAFNFYYKIAEKAREYKDRNGHFSKNHINTLAPHMWSRRNPPQDAEIRLSFHRGYVNKAKIAYRGKNPLVVSLRVEKPFFGRGEKRKGILTIPYTYFKHQPSRATRLFQIRAKQVGKKIKWFID